MLDTASISNLAQSIWANRVQNGIEGTAESDWNNAEQALTDLYMTLLTSRQYDTLNSKLDRMLSQSDQILGKLNIIEEGEQKTMAVLDDLKTQVQQNTSVEGSALTLIQGLAQQLQAAGTDPTALNALKDQLNTSATALAAAVAANTPAAPSA